VVPRWQYDIPSQRRAAATALRVMQQGRCGACECQLHLSAANVDHCHTTGWVRGLVCTSCNRRMAELDRYGPAGQPPYLLQYAASPPSGAGSRGKAQALLGRIQTQKAQRREYEDWLDSMSAPRFLAHMLGKALLWLLEGILTLFFVLVVLGVLWGGAAGLLMLATKVDAGEVSWRSGLCLAGSLLLANTGARFWRAVSG
jgi:hypothetical protein